MQERFAADRTLGKLAKWLRILGYDTLYERPDAERDVLRRAQEQGRIVLTRKRDWARHALPGRLVVVEADRVEAQIDEVLSALNIVPDPAERMTRCLHCNALLQEVPKASVEALVPAYVHASCDRFRRCPCCGKIYWPGTHTRHVDEYLRTHVPARRLPQF
ncbi:MAG: Mut7-C RNAse domain-containing protein [Syntrophales bacterium]